jgi:Uncharacterized conserved protein
VAQRGAISIGHRLPHVSMTQIAGLLEELASLEQGSGNSRISLPELAEDMHFSVDDLFPLIETVELLGFAQVSDGDIELTAAGREFVEADVQARKALFARHLLERVPLVARIRAVLDERHNHLAPGARFRNELEDHFSEDEPAACSTPPSTGAATPRFTPTTTTPKSSASTTPRPIWSEARGEKNGEPKFAA